MILTCRKCRVEIPNESSYCMKCGAKQTVSRSRRTRGNGMGSAYKTKSGRWQVEVVIGYNVQKKRPIRRTKGGFATKKEALAYAPVLLQNQAKQKRITPDSLYQDWSTSALLRLSQSKQTAYKIAYGKLQDILYRDIKDLTIGDLQSAVDSQGTSFYTKRDMKSLLSHLYNRAVAQQNVNVNLARYIVLPELEEKVQQPFTPEEQGKLWKHYADGDIFIGYILLMIYSGMMPGELIKAKKSMIKWDRQVIEGAGLKTRQRKAVPIVVADIILPVLQSLCEYSETEMLVSIKRNDFYEEFDAALKRCGCRDLTPYACRHTTATALSLNDIQPAVVQAVMRHAKYETTKRYVHIDTAPMLAAVNKVLGTFTKQA